MDINHKNVRGVISLSLWAMKAYNLPLLVKLPDPAASFQWNIKHKPLHLLRTTFATMIYGSLEVQHRNYTGTAIKPNRKSLKVSHTLSEPITQRKCYSKHLGFVTAEMLPHGRCPRADTASSWDQATRRICSRKSHARHSPSGLEPISCTYSH